MVSGKASRCCILPPIALLCCILLASAQTTRKFNVTILLESFPNFSVMNQLLSSSGVANEINSRQSLTLLAPSDDLLNAFISSNPNADAIKMADLLRYHVLLEFFSLDYLAALDPAHANYTSVTTLLQTTGRVNGGEGFVNIYNLPTGIFIGPTVSSSSSNTTVVTNITKSGFDISVIQIASVLVPADFQIVTGDLIKVLESRNVYSQFIHFLKSTGVDSIFASKRAGGGISVFAPTDEAFSALNSGAIQSLSVTDQKLLMEYHALTLYHNLDSLKTLDDSPVQTVASIVATGYKLNVSSDGKKVSLDTGINKATITEALSDARPVMMYSINEVLLPPELFPSTTSLAPADEPAPPPEQYTTAAPAPASKEPPAPDTGKAGNIAGLTKKNNLVYSAAVLLASSAVLSM